MDILILLKNTPPLTSFINQVPLPEMSPEKKIIK